MRWRWLEQDLVNLIQLSDDVRLPRKARWLLLGMTLPLFVVVLLLAIVQYRDQRRQILHGMETASATYAISLDTVAKLARDHVLQMQSWSSSYLAEPTGHLVTSRKHFSHRMHERREDGFSLDELPDDLKDRIGQVCWLGADPRQLTPADVWANHAMEFFGHARLTHQVTPYFRWSYFFPASKDHFVLYPWLPSAAMESPHSGSMREILASWYEYEIVKAGQPTVNPKGELYWVAPYLDAGGTGPMVSIGAPVYVNGEFKGSVGTDLTLGTLEVFMKGLSREIGGLWVIDSKNRLLADTAGSPLDRLRTMEQIEPNLVHGGGLARARANPGTPIEVDGMTIVVRHVANAPWTLVYGATEAEIRGLLLPRFVPYGIVLTVLIVNFFVAVYLLRRELIRPALALAEYIQHASTQVDHAIPTLPPLWRSVGEVVARTLRSNREASLKLQESEAFKSAIVETAMMAVITMDSDGEVVEFNRAAEEAFGITRQVALGQRFAEFFRHEGDGANATVLPPTLTAIGCNEGIPRTEVCAVRWDSQTTFPADLSVSVTSVGPSRYYTAFVVDLTLRKESERELARQREALRQSEKLSVMGSLLAGLAHELNNPLAILMGRAELLEQKVQNQAVLTDVRKIHVAADRCRRIVRTFMAMARKRPLQRRTAHIADVIAGALDLVGYSLRTSGIVVLSQIDKDRVPMIEMDSDQVGQIMVNLLINAQHALQGATGSRRLWISVSSQVGLLVVQIRDNGPGVSPDIQDRIFDPFFTTKEEGVGTGVGLSVSRAIARDHGGDLRLVRAEGGGAAFELTLPLQAGRLLADEAASRSAPESTATPVSGTALVVDDEPEVVRLLCETLRLGGYAAVGFGRGQEALAWLDKHECSLMLCDIRMPDLDGPQMWRMLKAAHPDVVKRMAFVTGDTLSARVAPFLRETAVPGLEKPFTKEDVLQLAHRLTCRDVVYPVAASVQVPASSGVTTAVDPP